MVVISAQVAAFVAALSVSVATAAVLPQHGQAQVHLSANAAVRAGNAHLGRRDTPTPPLPASVISKMKNTAGETAKHVAGDHHKGKKPTTKKTEKKKSKSKRDLDVCLSRAVLSYGANQLL